ncbi:MAG: RagB/SusD family nutrient uptake outer membrane protein [Bacteroidaceae bacterium]|nr:RagB/SusD family nutrient uptake outer membrane protein [Bacteroidaceae bacterium]
MRTKHFIFSALFGCTFAVVLSSCDSFLDITPTGRVIASTGEEYRDMLTNEYKSFSKDRYMTTIRTDELRLTGQTSSDDRDSYLDLWLWKDENPSPTTTYFSWRNYYHSIYIANYIIEHQDEIKDAAVKDVRQLVGEAYMMRAYNHFLLVNLYAEPYTHCTPATTRGVPMMLEANVNAIPPSSSVEAVYQQVLADISAAADYLNVAQWPEGKNYRFTTVSADALRARTYLYMGRWQDALTVAERVIAAHGELEDLNVATSLLPDNFKSAENIVALEQFSSNMSTVINFPSTDFINKYRTGDQRKSKYFKKATSTTYSLIKKDENSYCSFRSAEAYLTAAEAAAQLNDLPKAINLLKPLMQKRLNSSAYGTTLTLMESMTQAELLEEIYDERARELAFEGHRWYDLRRTTQPALTHTFAGETYTLTPEKYTMRFPTEAVESNPEIERW